MERIYTPKAPCPRDLGIYYCSECIEEARETSSNLDFNVAPVGCKKVVDGKMCGVTHLGYAWCKECLAKGQFVPNPHAGQFELVAEIYE